MRRRSSHKGAFVTTLARRAPMAAAGAVDTLQSIAVTFTDDGSGTTSGTTFRPTVGTQRARAVATGTYSLSGAQVITTQVTWTSGTGATATISNGAGTEGYCTPVSAGTGAAGATTLITATLGAVSGNATLTVDTARDATSSLRYPVNAYQWSLGGYTVDGIYLCNEASGNLTDVVGGITLTANATPLYQQAIAGHTRAGVGFNGTAAQRFTCISGVGPNPATTDIFWCAIGQVPTLPGTDRTLMAYGSAQVFQISATGSIRLGGANDVTTRPDQDDLVHPFGLLHDATNSRYGMFTDDAKTLATYAALTDSTKGLGAAAGSSPDAACVIGYAFRFINAAARMNDAAVKALYQWLGFTVPWS